MPEDTRLDFTQFLLSGLVVDELEINRSTECARSVELGPSDE